MLVFGNIFINEYSVLKHLKTNNHFFQLPRYLDSKDIGMRHLQIQFCPIKEWRSIISPKDLLAEIAHPIENQNVVFFVLFTKFKNRILLSMS